MRVHASQGAADSFEYSCLPHASASANTRTYEPMLGIRGCGREHVRAEINVKVCLVCPAQDTRGHFVLTLVVMLEWQLEREQFSILRCVLLCRTCGLHFHKRVNKLVKVVSNGGYLIGVLQRCGFPTSQHVVLDRWSSRVRSITL